MRTLTGPLIYPDGSPMASVRVFLRAQRVNFSPDGLVAHSAEHSFITGDAGEFVQTIADGDYTAWYQLPNSSAEQPLGSLVVEVGGAIQLGELLELSRDKSADYSISADWATKDWVNAQITLGAQPYDINLQALNPGTGNPGQLYRVSANGLLIEPFTPQLVDYQIGTGSTGGDVVRGSTGAMAVLPPVRKVSADTVAARDESLLIDMNSATGDVNITMPTGDAISQKPLGLFVESDDYLLPHTINVLRPAGQTIMGIEDNLQITRRRTLVLRYVDGNDWRFT